ncbi:MAG: LacI family DNA-binding transcriptional regulator [Lachnospiraceae bacterium]
MAVMRDVAKLAGVSISTVSFVLNGTAKEHKVADRTAQRVIHAARQLDYKINSSACTAIDTQHWLPTIAFYIPRNSVWIDMSAVSASIDKHMLQTGREYSILLCPYEKGKLQKRLQQYALPAYDAAVFSVELEEDVAALEQQSSDKPFVVYNRASERYASVSYMPDEAIAKAVQMMVAKKYQEILVLSGADSRKHGDEYLKLFLRCCRQQGLHLVGDDILETENTMLGGAIAARHILNMPQRPQMIICMSSALAFGAIPLLARNGILVPRDAELLCFGSSGDAEHMINYIPSLSMIACPLDDMTMKAFDMALRLVDGKGGALMQYVCPGELLLHDSFSL